MAGKNFSQLKEQLNPEQREAVEHIEGPVMVLAGPGTGKTQVVAMRIGEILARTQISARNILALTFTEAGVTALRQRLEKIIGPDAYQVSINTFHSFSNDIIATFPYLFNLDEQATQLTDLERLMLLEEIVLSLPSLSLLRPVKQPTTHIPAIGTAIRTAKQENVLPGQLRELAEADLQEAPELKSKLERDRQINLAKKNLELAAIYERYEAELLSRGQYDYEDMILRVVSQLQANDELRLHYQERYQYMLVDEYQDTNNAQNTLVETLASFFKQPNLFVVGDDKQAIYRFQGASVANMLHFTKKYPAIKIVILKKNYRSTASILNTADTLISHNRHQLSQFLKDVDSALVPVKKAGPTPRLLTLPTAQSQYDWIINEIKRLQKAGQPLVEMAVLFRLNSQVRSFRELAEKQGLLVGGILQSNLLNEPEIQLFVTILRAINNPLANHYTLPALRVLVGSEEVIELLEAAIPLKTDPRTLIKRLQSGENEQLQMKARQILDLHQLAEKVSLVELFEQIMRATPILEQIHSRPNYLEGLELLSAFFAEARRFSLRRPEARLKDFLENLQLQKKYAIQLPVNRILPERNGLFIATVHGAKGLEFESVFLPDVDEVGWNVRKTRSVITLPSTIVNLRGWNDDLAEDDRRVFYVGLTRAKNNLYLTQAAVTDEGREVLPCQFVAEMAATLEAETLEYPLKKIEQLYTTQLQPLPERTIEQRELEFIREQIKSRPFSFTDYKTYQLCPKQYLLTRIFRLNGEPTIPLIYGNALHRALELFFRAYRATKKRPSVAELDKFLVRALREQPPTNQDNQMYEQARRVLTAYYQRFSGSWQLPAGVEYSFRSHQVMLGDIWLTGKFDRLDVADPKTNRVQVIDYKTVTTAPSRNDIEGNTKNSEGLLKKQLIFYALLTRLDRLFPYRARDFKLSFIDDKETFKEEIFEISQAETDALAAEIKQMHQQILKTDHFEHTRDSFDKGCEICATFPRL